MSASVSPSSPAALPASGIVDRLRSAGCVFAEEEARLLVSGARTASELAGMVERRISGLPLEHVLGWAEFCGLRMVVEPGVFVPRRRTEFLVRQALEPDPVPDPDPAPGPAMGGGERRRTVAVDLCCGSGAVGAALITALGTGPQGIELHAADIDPAAVRCARRNIAAAGGAADQVHEGDLYEPLPAALRGRIGLLAANVPYVPTESVGLLPVEARVHEPRVSLDGGRDGLDVLRRVAAAAPRWLAPGGRLLAETSGRQAPQAVEVLTRSGLIPRVAHSEELNATVVLATRPAGCAG